LASLTIENYLKTIYQLCSRVPASRATTGGVADALKVSPGTVTSMLKSLQESGMVEYQPYEGVRLLEPGEKLALRVLRRHRLIELFLVETLHLSWDEVHDEAENMEHAVSDFLIDHIDKFLQYPAVDPHGDPIPKADGTVATVDCQSLIELEAGDSFRLVRVLDQSPTFLRYLSQTGLAIGTTGEVSSSTTEAGILTVRLEGGETSLSLSVAEKLLVAGS